MNTDDNQKGYLYKYPHPTVTTDSVVFGFDGKALNLLLIQRGIEPFKGKWAIPGGFIRMDETAEEGALRELREETGVDDIYLEQFHTFTRVDRDTRKDELTGVQERVMTIAFLAFVRQEDYSVIGGDDAAKAQWFPVKELPELAFDHEEIIKLAMEKLRWQMKYEPLAFRLLNKTFTMDQLRTIYGVVYNVDLKNADGEFDRRNFHKKILNLGYIVPTQERMCGVGRPGVLYKFDENIYKEKVADKNVF